jgi:hypothetical protein
MVSHRCSTRSILVSNLAYVFYLRLLQNQSSWYHPLFFRTLVWYYRAELVTYQYLIGISSCSTVYPLSTYRAVACGNDFSLSPYILLRIPRTSIGGISEKEQSSIWVERFVSASCNY